MEIVQNVGMAAYIKNENINFHIDINIQECKIGKPYCDYKSKINENTGEILETNNPDKKFSRNKKINQILN